MWTDLATSSLIIFVFQNAPKSLDTYRWFSVSPDLKAYECQVCGSRFKVASTADIHVKAEHGTGRVVLAEKEAVAKLKKELIVKIKPEVIVERQKYVRFRPAKQKKLKKNKDDKPPEDCAMSEVEEDE